MVTVGYSYPYIAKYDGSAGKDKYTSGMDLGEGVSYEDSIEVGESAEFYANNRVSEVDGGNFVSGEATITINGLDSQAAKMLFGIKTQTTLEDVVWLKYDDDTQPCEFGYGHVKKTKHKGKYQYWGFVLPRVMFAIHSENAETQEKEINFQTQELSATILRSLNNKHEWRVVTEQPFDTEEEAYTAVKAYLNQSE